MKKMVATRRLVISLFITGLLAYFMFKSTSPKVIFLPFLICSLSMAGQSIAQLADKEPWILVFHKLFVLGFALFWFGFLGVAGYICIRDKSYGMLLFTLPFWVVGFLIIKNKLLGRRGKPNKKDAVSPFRFTFVVSAILITAAVLGGIFLLALGIQRREAGLLFGGAFFVLGALAFVLGWLTINGYFEKCKIDVMGIYLGSLLAAFGAGILIWKASELKLWILIPVLMVLIGILQIVKCLKHTRHDAQ